MSQRLKKLKGQPLLNTPGEGQSPWMEISPKQIRAMRRVFQKEKEECRRGLVAVFFDLAVNMATLGFDVAQDLKDVEPILREEVRNREHWIWGPPNPEEFHWNNYVDYVAKMRRHGFDVSTELRTAGMDEATLMRHLSYYDMKNPVSFYTEMIAGLNELGFDVTEKVKGHEGIMREDIASSAKDGCWYAVAEGLVNMKRAGLEVTKEVERYGTQIGQYLLKIAKEAENNDTVQCAFVRHATYMHDLGLLKPRQTRETPPMPPLKKFQR